MSNEILKNSLYFQVMPTVTEVTNYPVVVWRNDRKRRQGADTVIYLRRGSKRSAINKYTEFTKNDEVLRGMETTRLRKCWAEFHNKTV